jgi:ParB/RepB/Spo0J family partition protein
MTTSLKHLNVSDIYEPEEKLRAVDRTTEAYLGLVESIRLKGVMTPISVRELQDEENNTIYGLVDGLQRLNASRDAGKETIPCHVIDVEEGKLLESQIIANVHKIETRPVEYSKAILKIIEGNPLLTREELATSLAKTPSWLSERLGLLKLTEKLGKLVDAGEIKLSNAYALAKLPPEEQEEFLEQAMAMTPQQFTPTVNQRIKEIRDAKRKGRDPGPVEFKPIPILRSRAEIQQELEHRQLCQSMIQGLDAEGAFLMALKWTLSLDPQSVEMQKAKDDERKAERERQKEKSKLERTRKRAEEAAKKAAELKAEAEEMTTA